ncbi:6757_t:CDS:2 [Ambispora gerdemannii]|uniref:6757_t:CDS:1 n=1 Tax=Ambispora gerdemannii TaxID=144530 RepID=A0A9N9C737_9GLOM|nr:6757_t:CDS:2 [Ambispora gerdemannii]
MNSDLFQELLRHQEMLFPHWISKIIYCFGITQDPQTQNYMLVVDYASEGDLHSYLEKNSTKVTWAQKLEILGEVASALVDIHRKDLIHGDLHTGNVLVGMALSGASVSIGDLGSCRPVNASTNTDDIYGVLPYIAPEVLNGEKYTSASDVYSFGMILWEVSAGRKPFDDRPHDYNLALEICNDLRPEVIEGTPWRYAKLMRQCWDQDPANRPSAAKLAANLLGSKDANGFGNSPTDINDKKWREYLQRITESSKQQKVGVHPDAVYSSRLLDFPIRRNGKVTQLMTKSVGSMNAQPTIPKVEEK